MQIPLLQLLFTTIALAVECQFPEGQVPTAADCGILVNTISVIIATQPAQDRPQLYGRRQIDSATTVKLPRVWQLEDPFGPPNSCAILITTPDNDLWGEETLRLTNVMNGGHRVLDTCLRPQSLLGFDFPGTEHKVLTSLERATHRPRLGSRLGEEGFLEGRETYRNGTQRLMVYAPPDVASLDIL